MAREPPRRIRRTNKRRTPGADAATTPCSLRRWKGQEPIAGHFVEFSGLGSSREARKSRSSRRPVGQELCLCRDHTAATRVTQGGLPMGRPLRS